MKKLPIDQTFLILVCLQFLKVVQISANLTDY
jgi:hypothetical protein